MVTGTVKVRPIPQEVNFEVMEKANSRLRIGISLLTMLFCIVGSLYSIREGKTAAQMQRESIYQKNRDRHAKNTAK
jgi:hypothetical protein